MLGPVESTDTLTPGKLKLPFTDAKLIPVFLVPAGFFALAVIVIISLFETSGLPF